MYEAGVFATNANIELIDGELVESLVTMKPAHAAAVVEIAQALIGLLGFRAQVRSQVPITLGDFSEPEPDICIARISPTKYTTGHPGAGDIFAIIEVADTSRAFDLQRKVPLYAALGIPETWVVDLTESLIHIFRKPLERKYSEPSVAAFAHEVALEAFPHLPFRIADLF
jgi:Uma2 family endonuclease